MLKLLTFKKVTPLLLNDMKKIKYLILLVLFGILSSCGKSDDPDPIVIIIPPSASALIFPNNNEECNTGESISESESKVTFRWNTSANTTDYTIFVKNLLTNVENSFNTQNKEIALNIIKNTPYKWWIISKSTGVQETAKSAEWKFYNSGDATITYAPFPAELVAPLMRSVVSEAVVTLEWNGSDVDDDLEEYELFFGTVNPPTEKLTTVYTEKLENVNVAPSTTYYWQVLSRDSKGNTSTSQVFQFMVD